MDLYIQFFSGENILGYKSPWDQRLSGFFNQELKATAPEKWKLIQLRSQMYQGDLSKFYLEEIKINKMTKNLPKIKKYLLNIKIVKTIFVKNKIINYIINE